MGRAAHRAVCRGAGSPRAGGAGSARTARARSRRAPWILVGALLVVTPRGAHAQDEPASARRVELALEECLGADAAVVRRIVAAELGDVLVGIALDRSRASAESGTEGAAPPDGTAEPVAPPSGGESEPVQDVEATLARVACGVEAAIVSVSHPHTDVRLERRIDLTGTNPNARARLLALSITELVAATWAAVDALPPPAPEAEPEPTPDPPPPEEPPPPASTPQPEPAVPPAAPPPPPRPLGVRIFGAARMSGTPVHLAIGAGLGIEIALPASLGVGADVRYEQGTAEVPDLGEASFRHASATVLGLVRPAVGYSSVSLGAGLRVGIAWVEGVPSPELRGRTHSGVAIGPVIVTQVALHVAGSGYVHIGLELGWILRGVTGTYDGRDVATYGGPQLSATLGFEIQPSR